MSNMIILEKEKTAEAVIGTYKWMDNGYAPFAKADISASDGILTVKLSCDEKEPLARYTEKGSPVWCDSCLEFFFSAGNSGLYVNFEANSNAAYLCNVGKNKPERQPADVLYDEPSSERCENGWSVTARFSLEKMCALFGVESINELKCNFFKCGDETEYPHFGMWSEIDSDVPNYHLPSFFGTLRIVG